MLTASVEEITQFVRRTVSNLVEDPTLEQSLDPDQSILGVGMDSLRMMNLLVLIETQFEIIFDDDELLTENFSTVNVIVSRIVQKLGVCL